ncbi:WhiB family transcriptional regulator [Streptomyces phaeochromogenes]
MNLLPPRNVTPHRARPQRSGRCPVMEQCLDWAVHVVQVEGIWGGTTESERRAMKRREARQAKGTVTTAA